MRRRAFAAPLIVVIACGPARGPAAPRPEEAAPAVAAPAPAPAPVVEEPAPAPVVEEPAPAPPAVAVVDVCNDPTQVVYCNPPRPPLDGCRDPRLRDRGDGRPVCTPAPPVEVAGDVVDVKDAEPGVTALTFAVGLSDGIAKGDRAVLLDAAGRPVPGGVFVVAYAAKFVAIGKVTLARDRIPAEGRVRVRHESR